MAADTGVRESGSFGFRVQRVSHCFIHNSQRLRLALVYGVSGPLAFSHHEEGPVARRPRT